MYIKRWAYDYFDHFPTHLHLGDGRVGRKDVRRIMRHFHLPDDKEHIDELFQIIPAAHMDYVTIAGKKPFIHSSST